jgi:hypothetical protein
MRSRLSLVALAAFLFAVILVPAAQAAKCDPIDARACLLPWPNDYFTKADKSTPTGKRLDLSASNMPKNKSGQPIQMGAFAGNDGFSPGSQIMTLVPGLDLKKTVVSPITNPAAYTGKSQAVVVIDTKTGKRWPIWSELNSRAEKPSDKTLDVHPAKNWLEGHRYIVALRNLKNASGQTIKPGKAFKAFVSGKGKGKRAKQMKSIFKTLKKAGIAQKSLYLAWDFTVASEKGLSSRFLTIRNDAFKQLGDTNLKDGKIPASSKAPSYSITKVTEQSVADDPYIARKVEGMLTVPCYLDKPNCPPGASMHYKSKKGVWTPSQMPGNVIKVPFACNIPRSSLVTPARPSLYGHGLLGDIDELNQGQLRKMSQEHNMVYCATPEIGMASEDVPNAATILQNFSTFNTFPDRLQQGMLDGLYLGRLMIHPKGLSANTAFKNSSGKSVINPAHLFYDGNSQGGIFGGGLTAVAPDFTRAVLGVVGMNYSLLVWRSTDFSDYLKLATIAYPDALDREFIINVMQTLWDRGEGDGYAQHMTTDPLPDTPAHQVLMHVAVGDHQVSQWAAEVEARTIGAAGYRPTFDAGRTSEKTPLWGIPKLKNGSKGSGIVFWDSGPTTLTGSVAGQNELLVGTDIPLLTNLAPVSGDSGELKDGTYVPAVKGNGQDPHEMPRNTPAARVQKSNFLQENGSITDQCGGKPCHSVKTY